MTETKTDLKVALFDFDGTLVNTTPLILASFRATWRQTFGFVFDDAVYIQTFGTLLPSALKRLVEKGVAEQRHAAPADLDAQALELLHTYRRFNLEWHDAMCEGFEGVAETLAELKRRGLRLGIVSSKMRTGVERGLKLFELAGFFDLIIGAEDVTNHKPHPEPLLLGVKRLAATPGETVYLGDSTHDIVAGKAAGLRTAAAAWGPFPRGDLERLKPDHLLDSPSELLSLF